MAGFLRWPLPSSLLGSAMLASGIVALGMLSGCLELREMEEESRDECAACHGGMLESDFQIPSLSAAPPYNLAGATDRAARGNGAHAAHLLPNDRARPLACTECHLVPEQVDAPGHMDTEYPAEIVFGKGPADDFEAVPVFDEPTQSCQQTFCHGGYFVGGRPSGGHTTEPVWTDVSGKPAECDACHGLPPPLPHPETEACSECHKNIDESRRFLRPELHVDGTVTFFLPTGD